MSNLIRWQPIGNMFSLREAMDRLYEDSWFTNRAWTLPAMWVEPTLDMFETADSVVVKASLPGVKADDVEITVKGNYLALSGESKEETETKDKNYLRRESRIGTFSRVVELPNGLETDRAGAKFEDGVLTITFPKAEQVKAKTIKVNAAQPNGAPNSN